MEKYQQENFTTITIKRPFFFENSKNLWGKNWFRALAIIIFIILLFIINLQQSYAYPYDADEAAPLLHGNDSFQAGTLFSNTWFYPSVTFFFTANFKNALLAGFFGTNPMTIHILRAFNYTILELSVLFFTFNIVSDKNKLKRVLIVLLLIIFPTANQYVLNSAAHTEMMAVVFILILLLKNYTEMNKIKFLIFYIILYFIYGFSDSLIHPIFTLPIILLSFLRVLQKKNLKADVSIFISTIFVACILHILPQYLQKNNLLLANPYFGSNYFLSIEDTYNALISVIKSYLYHFNANFFKIKISVSIELFGKMIGIAIFILAIISVAYYIKRFFKENYAIQLILISFMVQTTIFFLTNMSSVEHRYLTFNYLSICILISTLPFKKIILRAASILQDKYQINTLTFIEKYKKFPTILIIGLFTLFMLFSAPKISAEIPKSYYEDVSQVMQELGLKQGYAYNHWQASTITLDTKYEVKVRSILYSRNEIAMMYNLSDSNWFKENGEYNFIIIESGDLDYHMEILSSKIGVPDYIYTLPQNLTLLKWNKNISYRVNTLEYAYFAGSNLLKIGSQKIIPETESLLIQPGAFTYGPYAILKNGFYMATISGTNLDKASLKIQYTHDDAAIEISSKIIQKPEEVTLFFELNTFYDDIEFIIMNDSDEDIIVDYLTIE